MKEKINAIARMLEAMKNKFGQQSGEMPVKSITPKEFIKLCTTNGVEADTVHDIYAISVALVLGMIRQESLADSEIVLQVEALKDNILSSVQKAFENKDNLLEAAVGVVNLVTGEAVSERTVFVNMGDDYADKENNIRR